MLWLADADDDAEYSLNSSFCCQQRSSFSHSLEMNTAIGHIVIDHFMEIANKTMRLTWLAWLKTKCNYTLIISGFFYFYRDMRLLRSAILIFPVCVSFTHGMTEEKRTWAIALKCHQSNQCDPWDQIPSYCRIRIYYSVVRIFRCSKFSTLPIQT